MPRRSRQRACRCGYCSIAVTPSGQPVMAKPARDKGGAAGGREGGFPCDTAGAKRTGASLPLLLSPCRCPARFCERRGRILRAGVSGTAGRACPDEPGKAPPSRRGGVNRLRGRPVRQYRSGIESVRVPQSAANRGRPERARVDQGRQAGRLPRAAARVFKPLRLALSGPCDEV